MTLSQIAKYRLINQQIQQTKLKDAVDLVTWFGAVQAQEYAQTKWGLGLRLSNLTDDDIEKDFTNGRILRTHLLRPTWHLVTAEDIGWLLMLTAPGVNAINAYMHRQLELNTNIFNRCNNILIKILQGGKQLTRDAINNEFNRNKIEAKGLRLGYIMMYAELAGIICSGARQGNQFTYALLEERVPKLVSKSYEEALAELTKRYFASRNPATIKDFSTWSGLTLTECKKGIEMTKSYWHKEVADGNEYYFIDNVPLANKLIKDMYLLPIYDEFIMGYKDRSAIFHLKNKLKPTSHLHYDCMIVFDGQVIGTWKRTISQKTIDIEFEFFQSLNRVQSRAFDRAVRRFEEFANKPVNFINKLSC